MANKCALITGSSNGIGRATAYAFAEAGYDVCINCSKSVVQGLEVVDNIQKKGGKAIFVQADIGKMDELQHLFRKFFEEFGHIDALINNAGITRHKPILDVTPDFFDNIFNLNFKAHYFATQIAGRKMIEDKTRGSIINITSVHQEIICPESSLYGSFKVALSKFTRHAALEFAPYGIRVNTVAPGLIKVYEHVPGSIPEQRENAFTKRIPMQRPGQPEEIAKAILFLCSDDASYITGSNLLVDGGQLLPAVVDNIYTPRVAPIIK